MAAIAGAGALNFTVATAVAAAVAAAEAEAIAAVKMEPNQSGNENFYLISSKNYYWGHKCLKKTPGSPGETGNPGKLFFALDQTSQKLLLTFLLKVTLKALKWPRKSKKSRKSGKYPEIRVTL